MDKSYSNDNIVHDPCFTSLCTYLHSKPTACFEGLGTCQNVLAVSVLSVFKVVDVDVERLFVLADIVVGRLPLCLGRSSTCVTERLTYNIITFYVSTTYDLGIDVKMSSTSPLEPPKNK